VSTTSGTGRFEIIAQVGGDGSLLGTRRELEPGASITVNARYLADVIATEREDRGRWEVSYCAFDFCRQTLRLIGHSSDNALACTPPMVDFGAVNPGRSLSRTITCTNIANDTIDLLGWRLEGRDVSSFSAGMAAPRALASGESADIEVRFTPSATAPLATPLMAALRVDPASMRGRPLDPLRVALAGIAGGPAISVEPDRLSFGNVAVGTRSTKRLLVSNDGFGPLSVSAIEARGDYSAAPEVFTLEAGTSTVVEVAFAPQVAGDAPSELAIASDDSYTPRAIVALSGQGVDLPPCVYEMTPNPVTFGAVTLGETSTAGVRFENEGVEDCLLNDVELIDDAFLPPVSFALAGGPVTGLVIAPGDFYDFTISYSPLVTQADRAYLAFYVSDPMNSNPRVPIFGVGEATTEVTCPPNVSTLAGTAIPLSAGIITRGTIVTSINWTIINAPTGGIGTPNQWTPAPPNTPSVSFLPYIVGIYDILVEVTDDVGTMAACTFSVAAEGQGLRVSMTWNGPGDIDLHLNNSTAQPWFNSPNDCYYGDTTPLWDPALPPATGANPQLDFDNTVANGPENTTIATPIIGWTYTIAAHNFANGAGRQVTMEIFCGGVTAPTQIFTSLPLNGVDGGNCTNNDLWKVATVVFTSPSACVITPIDTYTASSVACNAY
jgi:hypothetical protein